MIELDNINNEPVSTGALTRMFHSLNRMLPENQNLIKIETSTGLGEALGILEKYGISQVPVSEGDYVVGIFSYRSFAQRLKILSDIRLIINELTVEDFIEDAPFVRVTDELNDVLDKMNKSGSILIGAPEQVQGILTAHDIFSYFYGISSPYIMLAEIELTLRLFMRAAASDEKLIECIKSSLSYKYQPDKLPQSLEALAFEEYQKVITTKDNWLVFEPVFGGKREWLIVILNDIRELRNDVFHFRRQLTPADTNLLLRHRNWFLKKAKILEAKRKSLQ
ncbi:MAG: CBS domain-containing protein [Ignavibacteriaceae bacterium]|nr:CBS domain-containing protein [Ignavibacteriaceae bacterium]